MNVLEYNIVGNRLTLSRDAVSTGGSVNYDRCSFSFDEEWEGFDRTAVFEIGRDSFRVPLDENDSCFIPSPCVERECIIRIGVYGTNGDTVIATNTIAHHIEEGIDCLGEWFEEDYSLVLNAIDRMERKVSKCIDDMDDRFEALRRSLKDSSGAKETDGSGYGSDCPDEWYRPDEFTQADEITAVMTSDNLDDYLEYGIEPLRRDFPDSVSRTQIGTDASGLPVYAYSFEPEKYEKTVLLTACTHGYDRMSFFALTNFLNVLYRSSESDRTLSYLKNRVKLIVIPAVNPHGLVTGQAFNANGVDINFNYPCNWEQCTKTTKGEAAADQPETQNVTDFVELIYMDRLCAAVDFHVDTDTESGKSIFYPRFKDNCLSAISEFVNTFCSDAEDGIQRKGILAASANPTLSNYLAEEYGINTCESVWHYQLFGGQSSDENYTKYLELMTNLIYTMAKNSSFTCKCGPAPFVKYVSWRATDETFTVPARTAPEEMGISNYSFSLDSPCIITLQGVVVLNVSTACRVKINPVLHQVNSPEQSYDDRSADKTFEQYLELGAGMHVIPVSSVLQAYYTSYNAIRQLRYCEDVRMAIALCASEPSAVQVTAFSFTFSGIPSDSGKPVVISSPVGNPSDYECDEFPVQQLIYPLESYTAADAKFSD